MEFIQYVFSIINQISPFLATSIIQDIMIVLL